MSEFVSKLKINRILLLTNKSERVLLHPLSTIPVIRVHDRMVVRKFIHKKEIFFFFFFSPFGSIGYDLVLIITNFCPDGEVGV